jgi:hypothetical protein
MDARVPSPQEDAVVRIVNTDPVVVQHPTRVGCPPVLTGDYMVGVRPGRAREPCAF